MHLIPLSGLRSQIYEIRMETEKRLGESRESYGFWKTGRNCYARRAASAEWIALCSDELGPYMGTCICITRLGQISPGRTCPFHRSKLLFGSTPTRCKAA